MAQALASYAFKGYAFRAYALASGTAVGDVVQYASPQVIDLGSSPTLTPSVLTGTGNVAETGGGDDALADMNAAVNATTGNITFGVGGATPTGHYSFELARNSGAAFVLIVNVVRGSSRGGSIRPSDFRSSDFPASDIPGSDFG